MELYTLYSNSAAFSFQAKNDGDALRVAEKRIAKKTGKAPLPDSKRGVGWAEWAWDGTPFRLVRG
jgi:hypothetical protein